MALIPPRPEVPALVTVLADASYCPDTHVAGYGYWIASDRGKKPGEGIISRVQGSLDAEMQAICFAIEDGAELGLIKTNDTVLIQTDCQGAMTFFQKHLLSDVIPEAVEAYQRLHRVKLRYNLQFVFKHVKGHTSVRDQRSRANRHCDHRARAAMRSARDARKKLT
jgi:ribonuclease HI